METTHIERRVFCHRCRKWHSVTVGINATLTNCPRRKCRNLISL